MNDGAPLPPLPGANWQRESTLADLDATADFAHDLAERLRPGDLVVLTGGLGAGKTTFVQALGEALGVEGQISSPTFVLSRVHRAAADKPDLVHVDAYRTDAEGLESLDLLATLPGSVTVVEWGRGLVERALAGPGGSWLDLEMVRNGDATGPGGDGIQTDFSETDEDIDGTPRQAVLRGYGPRWPEPPQSR